MCALPELRQTEHQALILIALLMMVMMMEVLVTFQVMYIVGDRSYLPIYIYVEVYFVFVSFPLSFSSALPLSFSLFSLLVHKQ